MNKILKLLIGAISAVMLIMLASMPLVTVGTESYGLIKYITTSFSGMKTLITDGTRTEMVRFLVLVGKLAIVIFLVIPLITYIVTAIRGILGGIFTKKKINSFFPTLVGMIFTGFIIALTNYFALKFDPATSTNRFALSLFEVFSVHSWSALLYISLVVSFTILSLTLFANSCDKQSLIEEKAKAADEK